MYKFKKTKTTSLSINESYEGETIESKVRRIMQTNEPITDTAPSIFTKRKDGVLPETDIRADKWETAIEAREKAAVIRLTKRAEKDKVSIPESNGGQSEK